MDDALTKTMDGLTIRPRFPHPRAFDIAGRTVWAKDVVEILRPFINADRRQKIERVISQRTYNLATVCEHIYDMGNVFAVMRSAESLGAAPLHVIPPEEQNTATNRISMGAQKWLDIVNWQDSIQCVQHLKAAGYQVVATHLDDTAVPLSEIDFTFPTALVFGNEHDGVSPQMLEHCDARCIIPMSGFAQSFNISVAAALALYHARTQREQRLGKHGDLTPDEMLRLRASYYIRALKTPERLILAHAQRHGLDEVSSSLDFDQMP